MQIENPISNDEIKLDSVLSLLLHAKENDLHLLHLFHERYLSLFSGDLNRLENILFEDGLIQYAVGSEGLEIGLTGEGLVFLLHGGYGSGITQRISFQSSKQREISHIWKYLILAGISLLLLCTFIILNNKG